MTAPRLAVVLFNLGGPDGQSDVKPFLFNLFRDSAIIGLPAVARYPIAAAIAARREKLAKANYALMGGGSPLLPETQAQAQALTSALNAAAPEIQSRVFIAMRYWKPYAKDAARAVAAFDPDQIVLLPLYPQYSTTTTASSLKAWSHAYKGRGKVRTVCCYPTARGLVDAQVEAIREAWSAAGRPAKVRLLFSAHGLPQKIVDAGDPYQAQVEATAAHIAAQLPELPDWKISYQSRVGPLKWLAPSTDEAIREAGREGQGVLIAPVAFVSEHVETLVELDHEYARLAEMVGCAPYLRARTPGVKPAFIAALAEAALTAIERPGGAAPFGPWLCPVGLGRCACREGKGA